ncbi:hypothetical protein DY000_02007120 [Brassica cretica]|uniref:Uncharacterized protein n=1 Tax=Brassica cretica TaxID=69181 RepID=A0ABQ7CFU5_BRACR|nr:hypothetical protein DY000_02007120 [Brassica cretica]
MGEVNSARVVLAHGRGDLGEVTSVETVLAYDRDLIQTDPLLDIPRCVRTRGSSGDPKVVEDPGGSPWILRSHWGPGGPSIDHVIMKGARRRYPEIVSGPWCIYTLRSHGNPEVLRDVMTPMRLKLHRGFTRRGSNFFFIFETLKPHRNPEGAYSAFLGKTNTGTCLDFHSTARKLATIKFLCCILLLQKVTDRLRGCWCGCYDPSARLRCFPRLEKQDFNCSLYFKVLLQ